MLHHLVTSDPKTTEGNRSLYQVLFQLAVDSEYGHNLVVGVQDVSYSFHDIKHTALQNVPFIFI